MFLLHWSKLVMMAGPLCFHTDQSLDMAEAVAEPTPELADCGRLCTVHIKTLSSTENKGMFARGTVGWGVLGDE